MSRHPCGKLRRDSIGKVCVIPSSHSASFTFAHARAIRLRAFHVRTYVHECRQHCFLPSGVHVFRACEILLRIKCEARTYVPQRDTDVMYVRTYGARTYARTYFFIRPTSMSIAVVVVGSTHVRTYVHSQCSHSCTYDPISCFIGISRSTYWAGSVVATYGDRTGVAHLCEPSVAAPRGTLVVRSDDREGLRLCQIRLQFENLTRVCVGTLDTYVRVGTWDVIAHVPTTLFYVYTYVRTYVFLHAWDAREAIALGILCTSGLV